MTRARALAVSLLQVVATNPGNFGTCIAAHDSVHGSFSFVLARAGAARPHARGHVQIRKYLAAGPFPEA